LRLHHHHHQQQLLLLLMVALRPVHVRLLLPYAAVAGLVTVQTPCRARPSALGKMNFSRAALPLVGFGGI
jgi:hypothetical protein